MTRAALALILMLAGGKAALWSDKHGVGLRAPGGWELEEGKKKGEVALIRGPELGGVRPYGVLRDLGASPMTLEVMADKVAAAFGAAEGRTVTAQKRKQLGAFPAVRFGLSVKQDGGKGRGRLTVVRMGDKFFSLELSAISGKFPAGAYDIIESSIHVKWTKHKTTAGLQLEAPPGWALREDTQQVVALVGPVVGKRPTMIVLDRLPHGVEPPQTAGKQGKALRFLGVRRKTRHVEKQQGDDLLLMVTFLVPARTTEKRGALPGWSCGVLMPAAASEDVLPVAAGILERVTFEFSKG